MNENGRKLDRVVKTTKKRHCETTTRCIHKDVNLTSGDECCVCGGKEASDNRRVYVYVGRLAQAKPGS